MAERLFGGTSNRARLYLLVDIIIACGFGFIIGTGLLMSTWFQIPLVNYDFWWSFHILFSIGTLIMVALKLLLHWRWIVTTFRKSRMVQRRNPVIPAPAQVAVNSSPIGRRQFLSVAGMIGIGTLVAASSALKSLKFIQDAQTNVYAQEPPAPTYESQPPQMIENTAPPISEPAPTSAATPTSVQATPTSAPVNCTVRCNHHCAYPGRCRKYVDLNNNNLCDYGECL
ncbi:MAG: hypothetical protein JW704_10160 [Anaerolineaceae bacterium]|nr:hypothetical protein [Anaerolineaceae bacterium]